MGSHAPWSRRNEQQSALRVQLVLEQLTQLGALLAKSQSAASSLTAPKPQHSRSLLQDSCAQVPGWAKQLYACSQESWQVFA